MSFMSVFVGRGSVDCSDSGKIDILLQAPACTFKCMLAVSSLPEALIKQWSALQQEAGALLALRYKNVTPAPAQVGRPIQWGPIREVGRIPGRPLDFDYMLRGFRRVDPIGLSQDKLGRRLMRGLLGSGKT